MKENDPVTAYFDKLPETHKRQFEEHASGANFNFQQRLTLACELGGAPSGRLLDCAAGTGEITCALLKSGRFNHATVVDVSPAMLQSAKNLLTLQIKNAELEFVQSDVFNFKPSDSGEVGQGKEEFFDPPPDTQTPYNLVPARYFAAARRA